MDRGETRVGFGVVMTRAWPEPPRGFVVRPEGGSALYVSAAAEEAVRKRGLTRWGAWHRALATGSQSSGRGMTAVIDGPPPARWRLKLMRRGGWLASLWRDRYPGARRLVETLRASVEALARGVSTASPVALIVEPGPAGLVRGAMAFEEIEGAEDLARRVVGKSVVTADLESAIGTVRAMHDRGVSHPDLNLGNILLRPSVVGAPQAFVIDLDRATVGTAPVRFELRQAAIRRLERSCAKLTGSTGPLGPGSEDVWYRLYAGEDADLGKRLASGRPAGRVVLAMHRLFWRRQPR